MEPTWFRREGLVHLTYELPHRVHTSTIYPLRAPNGSSVIIYGHEHGLSVVWKGGRPFKRSSSSTTRSNDSATRAKHSTGTPGIDDSIMIIDSDDEELANQTRSDDDGTGLDAFEESEEEYDPSRPYDPIVNVLEVPGLDSAVLHLAVAPAHSSDRRLPLDGQPAVLDRQIVVVAACADSTIRLMMIPLMPTQDLRSSRTQQYLVSEAKPSIRSIPRGVTATWTSHQTETHKWSLLIASHSAVSGGSLLVYECPLADDGSHFAKESIRCMQHEFTQSLPTSMSFSTARYPSRRHTQLLIAESKGTVRIYDPLPPHNLPSARLSQNLDSEPRSQRGHWLASLHAPDEMIRRASTDVGHHRRILDVRWAFDGNCVIVLFADGQWGLWDIEGVAPAENGTMPLGDNNGHDRSSPGGSISHFALRGFVGDSIEARSAGFTMDDGSGTSGATSDSTKLAPMTPRTRKVKQERLFSGPTKTSSSPSLANGGISRSSASDASDGHASDESVVFWHGPAVFVIPSLMGYWQRVAATTSRTQESFTLLGPSITQLDSITTSGELITEVSQPAQGPRKRSDNASFVRSSKSSVQHDILVCAEHRLVILSSGRNSRERTSANSNGHGSLQKHVTGELEEDDMVRLDQDLLSRGELDVGGIDRILDELGAGDFSKAGAGFDVVPRASRHDTSTRKVGFVGGF